MSLAVVVCPACRGASRVPADALGHMVSCPRCESPFVAEEDVPVVQPVARPPRAAAVPVAPPPRRRRREPLPEEPAETDYAPAAPAVPDPEHDPHLPPPAGLPVSVLVGLALLPFGIPPLWWAAPVLTGQESALSLAVPVALSVAAAALCLGVVYTIDWTATTRIKGVLMLVGLAYLSAAGLFFLKKDLMDRVQRWGGAPNRWTDVSLQGECRVRMPANARSEKPEPLPGLVKMAEGRRAQFTPDFQDGPGYDYWVGVSEERAVPKKPDEAWFDRVGDKVKAGGGTLIAEQPLAHQERPEAPGRQWTFDLGGDRGVRIVRVFAIKDRVYYLSAEGPNLMPQDEFGKPFFESFFVTIK